MGRTGRNHTWVSGCLYRVRDTPDNQVQNSRREKTLSEPGHGQQGFEEIHHEHARDGLSPARFFAGLGLGFVPGLTPWSKESWLRRDSTSRKATRWLTSTAPTWPRPRMSTRPITFSGYTT